MGPYKLIRLLGRAPGTHISSTHFQSIVFCACSRRSFIYDFNKCSHACPTLVKIRNHFQVTALGNSRFYRVLMNGHNLKDIGHIVHFLCVCVQFAALYMVFRPDAARNSQLFSSYCTWSSSFFRVIMNVWGLVRKTQKRGILLSLPCINIPNFNARRELAVLTMREALGNDLPLLAAHCKQPLSQENWNRKWDVTKQKNKRSVNYSYARDALSKLLKREGRAGAEARYCHMWVTYSSFQL